MSVNLGPYYSDHCSPYWRKYDHGFHWLCGIDLCPGCGVTTTKDEALFYFGEKKIDLVNLRELAKPERLHSILDEPEASIVLLIFPDGERILSGRGLTNLPLKDCCLMFKESSFNRGKTK